MLRKMQVEKVITLYKITFPGSDCEYSQPTVERPGEAHKRMFKPPLNAVLNFKSINHHL